MNAQKRTLRSFKVEEWIIAVLLFVMSCITFINVLSRYFFHFSFAATEEITINMFVWMSVAGAGIAFRRGSQLGMVSLFKLFPAPLRKAVIVLSAILSAGLFLLVSIFLLWDIRDEITLFHATSGALGIPIWIYYAGSPVLSVFVFNGIYRDAADKLKQMGVEGGK